MTSKRLDLPVGLPLQQRLGVNNDVLHPPVSNRLYMTWVMRPRVEWRVGVKNLGRPRRKPEEVDDSSWCLVSSRVDTYSDMQVQRQPQVQGRDTPNKSLRPQ